MNVAKERAPKEKSEMDTGEGEREREESVEAPVSRRLEPAVVVPLYACEPRRRDIAPRDAHAGWGGGGRERAGGATVSGPSGIIDVSHREQRAACSSL